MTDEMGQIDGRDDQPEVEEHPELAAIADSLEPDAAPEAVHDPVPDAIATDAPDATAEPEPEDQPEVEAVPEVEPAPEPEPAVEPAPETEPAAESAPEPEPATTPAVAPVAGTEFAVESAAAVRSPDAVSWWPFLSYLALWVVFAGVVIWRFYDLPQGQAVYESPLYPLSVFGGVALTVAGPLLSFATWVAAWGAPGSSKWGQFVSALVKGSAATAGGVVLWWLALVIVDQIRLGRVF